MQKLLTPSDNDLIIEARSGSDMAFARLVQRYDRQVFLIAAKYFQSSDDAKDVYQEVFLRIYNNLKKFEFRSEFSTWLFRITTNVCLTHKRQIHNRRTESLSVNEDENGQMLEIPSPEEHEPEKKIISDDTKNRVRNAIEALPPKQKMVFTLKHDGNFKIREIASMMECTEGTVKKYLFLAVEKLRIQLKSELI